MTKLIGLLVLAIYQAYLAAIWLGKMAWWLLVTLPWGIYGDAQRYRTHECPKPETFHAQDAPFPQVNSRENPAPAPVANDDTEGDCWFCSHAKSAHEDDYACAYTDCDCETEQYSRPPTWHPGDPLQFRDRVVDLDGDVTYQKVMA